MSSTLGGAVLEALGIDHKGVVSFQICCAGPGQKPRVTLRKVLFVDKTPTYTFETREIVSATKCIGSEPAEAQGGAV